MNNMIRTTLLRARSVRVLQIAMFLCVTLLGACTSEPTPVVDDSVPSASAVPLAPTATPLAHALVNPAWSAPPSIDELIFNSRRVVEATLSSVSATTETIDNGTGVASTYRPVHELRFTVTENLMGSGSTSVLVVVRGEHTYATKSAAQAAADARTASRITTWDNRKAILFLDNVNQPYTSSSSAASRSEDTNQFVLLNFDRSSWDYSVEASSRAWLPAQDSSSNSDTGGAAAPATRFITGVHVSPPQTITKSALKSSIATMTQRLGQGKNVVGYSECVSGQIAHERHRRAVPWSPYEIATTIASGTTGAEAYRWTIESIGRLPYTLAV